MQAIKLLTNRSSMATQTEGADKDNQTPRLSIFSRETLIPVGFVLTIAGASMFSGVMYQRINTIEDQLNGLKRSIDSISAWRDDTVLLKEQLRQVGIVVQEVREDVKDLKDRR